MAEERFHLYSTIPSRMYLLIIKTCHSLFREVEGSNEQVMLMQNNGLGVPYTQATYLNVFANFTI